MAASNECELKINHNDLLKLISFAVRSKKKLFFNGMLILLPIFPLLGLCHPARRNIQPPNPSAFTLPLD
jgi:hypothetical protein